MKKELNSSVSKAMVYLQNEVFLLGNRKYSAEL